MNVYKFRYNYKRDIKSLSKARIFTPNMYNLNDPFEGIITPKIFQDYEILRPHLKTSDYERKIFLHKKLLIQIGNTGIYTLSKTWNNELLWSHYSDSHKGFCIEYDLDNLIMKKTKTLIFPKIINIEYSKEPPIYTLQGTGDIETRIIKVLAGTKSKSWKYEKEIRIIFMECGEQEINPKAIKSIIFGLHASDKDINYTFNIMKNDVKYYKIEVKNNSYKLIKKKI